MQLIAWLGLCALGSYLLRRHLTACLIAILALWFLVPTVGSYLLTGQQVGPLSFHAATWLILAVAAVQLLHAPQPLWESLRQARYFFLVTALVLAVALVTTRTVQSGGGMVLFVDQMVTPAVFFLLILAASRTDGHLVLRLRNTLMLLACVVVAVAVLQWTTKSVLFYEAGFQTQFWFKPENQRWMGTFDQPLALSLVLVVLAPMVAGIRRLWLAVPMLAVIVVGVVISQSRLGLGIVVVTVLYAVLFSKHAAALKLTVLAALAIGVYYLLLSPLVTGILARIADDTGSAEARNQAYRVFFHNWANYLFTGDGLTASYTVAEFAGLETSFESSFMMYAVDIGIVFAVLYFGGLLAVVLRSFGRHSVRGLSLAGLLVVLIPQTYSGVATRSVAGIVLWTVVAMVAVAASDRAVVKVPAMLPLEPERGLVPAGSAAPVPPVPRRRRLQPASTWIGR
jgi:hypothetical protein